MKKAFIIIIVSLFLIITVQKTYSKSSSKIKYLLNEPLTLMDFGIFKLNKHLKQITLPNNSVFDTKADYDAKTNRLNIDAVVTTTDRKMDAKDMTEARKWCKLALNNLRMQFDIDPATGEEFIPLRKMIHKNYGALTDFFNHSGQYKMSEMLDKGIFIEIDRITYVRSWIPIKGRESPLHCYGHLVGKDILFTD